MRKSKALTTTPPCPRQVCMAEQNWETDVLNYVVSKTATTEILYLCIQLRNKDCRSTHQLNTSLHVSIVLLISGIEFKVSAIWR